MKKLIYASTVLLVLAGSTAPAVALPSNHFSDKKTTQPTQPGPDTNQIPPTCPYNDPNGCGIFQ